MLIRLFSLFRSILSAFKICDPFFFNTLYLICMNLISRYKLRETERKRRENFDPSIFPRSSRQLGNFLAPSSPKVRARRRNVYKVSPARSPSLPPFSLAHPARNQRAIIRSVARQSFKLVGRPPTRGCPRRHRLRRVAGTRGRGEGEGESGNAYREQL